MEITDFNIALSKDDVLRSAGCAEGSAVYDAAAGYYNEYIAEFEKLITPRAAISVDDGKIYCAMTLGGDVSEFISQCFRAGKAVIGLLLNTMADEYLFEMDKRVNEEIRLICAKSELGIKRRLGAPEDFPLSEQAEIIEKTRISEVTLTDAFMLNPEKSMTYILDLTDDTALWNSQHDCSKCSAKDCPRRSAAYSGNFEILANHSYTAHIQRGKSALCIDIGTTTVAFEYICADGSVFSYKTLNPQKRFGTDVLSRIDAANRGRLNELSSAIRYTLMKGYRKLARIAPDIVVIAGNTTMIHLLMGYSCASLGKYPFISEHLATRHTTFDKVASAQADPVKTVIYGGISAFVGGDIVSGLYMCGFDKAKSINMFIDLGTNGEMAIGNKDKIIVTSTAAGPAFEGGRLTCGTGSIDGAIYSVSLRSGQIKTIGSKKPAGICGTGVVELAAEMLDNGIIDNTGLLSDKYFKNGYPLTENIVFTQEDIRQVQMAKSAVRSGIECLINAYGAKYSDIDTVYLAGGFGYGLSADKACRIGILPPQLKDRTRAVGNSSLGGCVKYCSENGGDDIISHIQGIAEEFPLAEHKDFEGLYIEHMNF